jgi:two-component system, LuxR family, sensor histidine kinase DctS
MQAMPLNDPPAASGLRRLRLSAHPLQTPADAGRRPWVVFEVVDHGQGIAAPDAERLFSPFFTTKADGMGLGLNLCRTVIEQHGGTLSFEPHPVRGTVFRFTLPGRPYDGDV